MFIGPVANTVEVLEMSGKPSESSSAGSKSSRMRNQGPSSPKRYFGVEALANLADLRGHVSAAR